MVDRISGSVMLAITVLPLMCCFLFSPSMWITQKRSRRLSPVSAKAWHSQPADEVLAQPGSAVAGLSAQEAARRLAADGLNELTEGKRIRPLQIFAALVFAELLRSVGARSETRPIWRMNFFSNFNLLAVVAVSFAIQVWSQHNAFLARFLQTSLMSFGDCLMILAISAVPLLVLGVRKVWIHRSPAEPTSTR